MTPTTITREIMRYVVITLAGVMFAVTFCWFYQPNAISMGGFTGIAQIVNHYIPAIPVGITTFVINLPLFIVAVKLQGPKLVVSSLYSMAIGSLLIDIIMSMHEFQPMDDKLLASIFGGVMLGVSSGISLKAGATSGGTELAARLLKYKFHHVSVGNLCLAIDLIVIIGYAISFRGLYNALYGIISMYIFSVAMDFIIYGFTKSKMAYIISSESDTIKSALLDMNLGVTLIDSRGGWSGEDKKMVMCAFRQRQIGMIESIVTKIDKDAFVIVCDTHEVVGEGFSTYKDGQL